MPPTRRRQAPPRGAIAELADLPLPDQVDAVTREADIAARTQDIAAGLVPDWVRRSLHPHELAARVSFAAIDANEQQTAGRVARRLTDDRRRLTALLAADFALLDSGRQVVDRLVALEVAGLVQLPGAAQLLNTTATDLEAELRRHADEAAALVFAEARAQGVTTPAPFVLDPAAGAQLEQLAQRLAVAPHVDLVRALRDEAVRLPTPTTAALLDAQLAAHAATLSTGPLELAARCAAAQTDGLARQSAAATILSPPVALAAAGDPPAAQIYASELLDGNTCAPCSLVDGTTYPDLDTARLDYPTGIYVDCEGGDRCRGTLVFVWGSEAPPTDPVAPIAPRPRPPAPPPAPVSRWTRAELDEGAAALPDLRRAVRAEAHLEAEAAWQELGYRESPYPPAPPVATQVTTLLGRQEFRRGAGSWDWLEQLDEPELKRYRRWFDTTRRGELDAWATAWGDAHGMAGWDTQQVVDEWRRRVDRFDAAKALRVGKLPSPRAYPGLDVNALVPDLEREGWDIARLMGGGDDAAAHVLEVWHDRAAVEAERELGAVTDYTRGPAPWRMSQYSYEAELYDVEGQLAGFEFDPAGAPADLVARWHELVPGGQLMSRDELTGLPLPPSTLWETITTLARVAGYEVPSV
jgi:hypothetical protein